METATFKVAALYARVGPRLFPGLVAAGLLLVGVLLAWQAVRGGWDGTSEEPRPPVRWAGVALVSAGLIAQILLIDSLGFVLSSAILFWFVALAFGSRRYLRDAAAGLILAVVVFIGFTRGLDLPLPGGILEGLF